jgi:hypothetical protein
MIPSKTVDGMLLPKCVSDRIRHANLKLKPSKCPLYQTEATILGVIISDGTVCEDPERVSVA